MKMNTLYAALSGVFLLGAASIAAAQSVPSEPAKAVQPKAMENKAPGMSGDEYKREKDRVEADAKAAKEKCKSLKDNAKDICEAEAKAKEKVAKKELDYKKNPNDKNLRDLEKMKAEAAYEVAKEKCEDMKGADQATCKKNAKDEKDKAIAGSKGKKVADSTTATTRTTTSGPASGTTMQGSATPSTTPSGTPGTGPSAVSAGTKGTADSKQNKSGQ